MVTLVTDYLDRTSRRYPEKTALVDKDITMSFAELRTLSRKIASQLIRLSIQRQPILIIMEKSAQAVAAFMGAAYSGNFYTPIDLEMPPSRIAKILEILQPAAVVSKGEHADMVTSLGLSIPVLNIEDCDALQVDDEAIARTHDTIIDTDLLYVLFTSGSTGIPKGVSIGHRSVIDYTEWLAETFHFTENDVFGNQAPFYFDNSVLDIYSMLKNGSTLYIIPKEHFAFPVNLLEYLANNKINVIFWVPSALVQVANLRALKDVDVSCLDKILFCGEVMPNKQLNVWRRHVPDALYANLYGPTEITDVCTYYIVNREFADTDSLPIGKGCRNTDILVLNDQNKPVTGDEIGELCVRGSSLSFGYYNNPEKTKEAFVQNPLNTRYPEMIYRTGDLVKYNEYGEIIYLSRKDFQIKHMGHRIELGEIETAASSINGVEMVACVYDDKRSRIVMFYKGTATKDDILSQMRDMVSEYMVPRRYNQLEEMPLNLNGKIDRVQLKGLL